MAEKEDTKSKRDPFEFIKQKAAEVAAKAEEGRRNTPANVPARHGRVHAGHAEPHSPV